MTAISDMLMNYGSLLKQLDIVVAELETVGFVTIADRDRWERLITPERLRIGTALKAMGVSPLSKLPALPSNTVDSQKSPSNKFDPRPRFRSEGGARVNVYDEVVKRPLFALEAIRDCYPDFFLLASIYNCIWFPPEVRRAARDRADQREHEERMGEMKVNACG